MRHVKNTCSSCSLRSLHGFFSLTCWMISYFRLKRNIVFEDSMSLFSHREYLKKALAKGRLQLSLSLSKLRFAANCLLSGQSHRLNLSFDKLQVAKNDLSARCC